MAKSFSNFAIMDDHPIILFDGICNFCNSTVNFIIKRDHRSVLKFAALQSDIARKELKKRQVTSTGLYSFILIEKGKVLTRSAAALNVCRYMGGLWPLMYGLIIVPRFIRDGIYNLIARNRYHWFGAKEVCMPPDPAIRSRFLNETI